MENWWIKTWRRYYWTFRANGAPEPEARRKANARLKTHYNITIEKKGE